MAKFIQSPIPRTSQLRSPHAQTLIALTPNLIRAPVVASCTIGRAAARADGRAQMGASLPFPRAHASVACCAHPSLRQRLRPSLLAPMPASGFK
eukprot:4185755-Pleurochrysis_carterae.AAC.1